jgi:hypothetical protein
MSIHPNDQRRYFGDWDSIDDVRRAFSTETPVDDEVVLACYTGGGYDGSALVVFRHDGKLFEVYGSHCSCYGLEGQWEPEETTPAALAIRDLWMLDEEAKRAFHALWPEGSS